MSVLRKRTEMLAIVCGGGHYPLEIAKCCQSANVDFVLVFVRGSTDESLSWPAVSRETFDVCELNKLLHFLKDNSVDSLIFAGHIKRPNLFSLALDKTAQEWIKKIGTKVLSGDDGLLRAIADLFALEGISVIDPKQYTETLKVHDNVLTVTRPSQHDMADVFKGIGILNSLSSYDIGQSIIIENGVVIGIECVEGTDALINRCRSIKKTKNDGVLVKMSKIDQDHRFDLPTIGMNTIEACHLAGVRGIAIEKKNSIFLDRKDAISCADKYGIFVIAVNKEQELHECISEYL